MRLVAETADNLRFHHAQSHQEKVRTNTSFTYQAGSWGPRGTYRLFDRDDQFWRHSLTLEGADIQAY